jgi:SAM-dependent methyltransferase
VSSTPQRIKWAVECLDVNGTRRIIEFGCGNGLAISSLLRAGHRGTVDGIDRSSAAIDRATRENANSILRGTVQLIHGDFIQLRPAKTYDHAFAVNVNDFWTRPANAFAAASEWVSPRGQLLLVYEAPSTKKAEEIIQLLVVATATLGFALTQHHANARKDALVALHFRGNRTSV